MATPHPGNWQLVLNETDCELYTNDVPVHAAIIYDNSRGRWHVLYFGFGTYRSYIWSPENPTIISGPQNIPPWPVPTYPPEVACSGHTFMEDGRLFVAGGSRFYIPAGCPGIIAAGISYTYIFNPVSKTWTVAGLPGPPHAMADGRFYPTVTILGEGPIKDGLILSISGNRTEALPFPDCMAIINKDPEIYDLINGWSFLQNQVMATQPFDEPDDLYLGAHVIPYGENAGKIFYSIPMKQAWLFNPFADTNIGEEYWLKTGSEKEVYRHDGCSVLLPILPGDNSGKVIVIGGGNPSTNTVETINTGDSNPDWAGILPMFFARRNLNAVILPDDRILVIGGNESGQLTNPVFTPEVYDTETGDWTLLPAMNIPRMYHSVALLMPDGRVWVGGTDWQGTSEKNIEIYSPGYLFEGSQPEIIQAPANITYGTQFQILTSSQISYIRLIRLSSLTHSTNFEQRSIGLSFQQGPINGQYPWNVVPPANANIAPPGYYMLFVLKAKSESISGESRIPSAAKIVKLSY